MLFSSSPRAVEREVPLAGSVARSMSPQCPHSAFPRGGQGRLLAGRHGAARRRDAAETIGGVVGRRSAASGGGARWRLGSRLGLQGARRSAARGLVPGPSAGLCPEPAGRAIDTSARHRGGAASRGCRPGGSTASRRRRPDGVPHGHGGGLCLRRPREGHVSNFSVTGGRRAKTERRRSAGTSFAGRAGRTTSKALLSSDLPPPRGPAHARCDGEAATRHGRARHVAARPGPT